MLLVAHGRGCVTLSDGRLYWQVGGRDIYYSFYLFFSLQIFFLLNQWGGREGHGHRYIRDIEARRHVFTLK